MDARCRGTVTTRFISEALTGRDRSGFVSGNDRIDTYFRTIVSQDIKRRYASCYLLIERETEIIAGFYTLAACSVGLADVPEALGARLPRYPTIPAVLIGWLGRDLRFRSQRIGSMLLADALRRVTAAPIAAHAIVTDPIDRKAAAFYGRHQFLALPGGRLYLPVATAQGLFGG